MSSQTGHCTNPDTAWQALACWFTVLYRSRIETPLPTSEGLQVGSRRTWRGTKPSGQAERVSGVRCRSIKTATCQSAPPPHGSHGPTTPGSCTSSATMHATQTALSPVRGPSTTTMERSDRILSCWTVRPVLHLSHWQGFTVSRSAGGLILTVFSTSTNPAILVTRDILLTLTTTKETEDSSAHVVVTRAQLR